VALCLKGIRRRAARLRSHPPIGKSLKTIHAPTPSCSADRPAGGVLCRVLPIAGRCRSSGRSGLRLATRSRPAFLSVNRPDAPSACAGSFFIGLDDCAVLRGMAWPGAHVGKAQFLQQRRDMALVIVDAETRLDDLLKIDAPPAHHAIDGRVGTGKPVDPDTARQRESLLPFPCAFDKLLAIARAVVLPTPQAV
jgi:hypothetical protein